MESTDVSRARIVLAAIGLAIAVLAYAVVDHPAAGGAAVPASQADAVEREIARTNIGGRMEVALGRAFGGVWFEASTARVHVGVTSPASRALAEDTASSAGLAGVVAETRVASSWASLRAAQDRLSGHLADLFAHGQVKTGLSASANSVQVQLASSVSPARRSRLEEAARATGVGVEITTLPEPYIRSTRGKQCATFEEFKAFCDPTIVGGVRIENAAGGSCSAGPAVIGKDRTTPAKATRTYILTAGHCVEGTEKWYAIEKKGKAEGKKELGKAGVFLNAETDVGVIEVIPPVWAKEKDPIPVEPVYAEWAGAEIDPTQVTTHTDPMQGVDSCFSGQRSGKKCGTIETTDAEITFDGEPVVTKNLVEVTLDGEGTGGEGDSGGPFYREDSPGYVEGTFVGFDGEEAGNPVYGHSLSLSFEKLEEEKGLALELLDQGTKKRKHPVFTAAEYPVTVSAADAASEDEFTAFGATVKCTENEFDGELTKAGQEEDPMAIELTPVYRECTALSLPVTFSNNGCKYRLILTEESSEGSYSAEADVVCPEGKPGLQFHVYTSHANQTSENPVCTVTVPAQSGLESVTLTNSGSDVLADQGSLEGVKAKIHRNSFLCPSTGTEAESSSGAYHHDFGTASGTSGAEAVKIDIGSE